MDTEVLYVVGALFAGLALGILVVLPFALRSRAKREVSHDVVAEEFQAPRPAAPAASPRPPPASDEDSDHFGLSRPSFPAAPHGPHGPSPAPPPDTIPTEWAKRITGPLEEGRVRGICSGCGTKISVSGQRPVRIACPVCGRTRLLT